MVLAPVVSVADPDLVLHYRFDRDQGDKVEDHSGHRNNGVNKSGMFMNEVQGRRGVMRFDGEKSQVQTDGDSLALKGDFSFALWVRLNGIEKTPDCILFGTSQYFFSLGGYLNLVLYGYGRTPEGDDVPMGWPVDRDILGTDWSHITVVVAYPRVRFYRNGRLIRDAWMPFTMEGPREDGTTLRLGSNGRDFGFIDLDEAMVFNRALSPDEVGALAAGIGVLELPRRPHEEILMEPYWYEDRLSIHLSAYHQFDLQGGEGRARVTLTTPDGEERAREVPSAASRASGSARTVAAADFRLSDLVDQAFRARVDVIGADGEEMGSVNKDFLLEKPAWVHNRVGYPDVVPDPWTPVEVENTARGADIRVWGRRYRVEKTPFFTQIESKGAAMLAEPMTLNALAKPVGDGIAGADTRVEPVQWGHEKTDWINTDEFGATFVQTFSAAGMTLEITGHTEYDGFTRFDCRITARESTELSQLFLEMPVAPRNSFYAYAHNVRPAEQIEIDGAMRTDYSKMNQSGRFDEDMAFPFTCEASLGDDERMLVWQAESPAGWNNRDENQAVEFLMDNHAHTLRIRFIDQVTLMRKGEERILTFALLATPAKPLIGSPWEIRMARSEPMGYDLLWPDHTFESRPATDHVADMGIRALMMTGAVSLWPYPLPLGNEWYSQQLKRQVQAIHASGLKTWSYIIHQRFPLTAPEFEFNGSHMAVGPFKTYSTPGSRRGTLRGNPTLDYGPDSNCTFDVCPASRALRDANVYALHKRLTYYGEDGVYLDGTSSYHWPCKNTKHGCGYVDAEGVLQPSRPIFGVRRYMQRIYVATKSVNPDHTVDVHDSFGLNSSGLVYGDILSTGERWHHLNTTLGGVPYVAEAVPLDIARHEFSGRQHNVPFVVHTHRLGDYGRISATTLLLDVPAFPSVDGSEPVIDSLDRAGETIHHKFKGDTQVFSLICRVRDEFGADEAERILYYEDVEKYVTIAPASKECYTTLFLHPSNGVLAFVTNRSIEKQHVDLAFDLEALGLANRELEARDTMYNRILPMEEGGKVLLDLDSERWTYLWLKPI
jgi:hypothetical protein